MKKIGYYILLIVFITIISLSTVNADDSGNINIDSSLSIADGSHNIKIASSSDDIADDSVILNPNQSSIDSDNQNLESEHGIPNERNNAKSLNNLKSNQDKDELINSQKDSNDSNSNQDENEPTISQNNPNKVKLSDSNSDINTSNYAGKVIFISESTYDNYFDKYTGQLLSNNLIKDGDIIKIGNISNRLFSFNKKVFVTAISYDCTLYNCGISLLKGSDGSTVTGLRIENNKFMLKINGVEIPILYGFFLNNTNNNTLSFNYFNSSSEAGFGLYGYNSSYNTIVYNTISTGDSNDETTSCFVMDLCNYNEISYNNLHTIQSNVIYFNHYGWAGMRDVCIGNNITNNHISTDIPSPMSYGMQIVYGFHDGNQIINNTIDTVSQAINLKGENITISANRISNITEFGINSNGINAVIEDNTIMADEGIGGGIDVAGDNITVKNNQILLNNGSSFGIRISSNTSASGNTIIMGSFGTGIVVQKDNCSISNNRIVTIEDSGISIKGSLNNITDNIIDSKKMGIEIRSPSIRIYNSSIMGNRINSESYGIYIYGLVYNSRIGNNIIETNASEGIYRKVSDELGDNLFDNIINGVITDPTAITVNNSNYYDYFDENGYLNFTFKEGANGVIFFSYLSNKNIKIDRKLYIMSNNENNFLFNVRIEFLENSDGSILKDLNFYSINEKNVISINNASNILISGNNISMFYNESLSALNGKDNFDTEGGEIGSLYNQPEFNSISSIKIEGNSKNIEILNNNIYLETILNPQSDLNSQTDSDSESDLNSIKNHPNQTFGILILNSLNSSDEDEIKTNTEGNEDDDGTNGDSTNDDENGEDNNIQSNDELKINNYQLIINENNIIIHSDNHIEAINTKSLKNSQIVNNYINILSDEDSYGIHIEKEKNGLSNSTNLNISSNTIVIYSKTNGYGISINNTTNSFIEKNTIFINSSKAKGIIIYSGMELELNKNSLSLFENESSTSNQNNQIESSVIEFSKDSKILNIQQNIIDTNVKSVFVYNSHGVRINMGPNKFIIGDYNFLNYFTDKSNGLLYNAIKKGDYILLRNLSSVDSFTINIPLDISSYDKNSFISSSVILNSKAEGSRIHDLTFEIPVDLNTQNLNSNQNTVDLNAENQDSNRGLNHKSMIILNNTKNIRIFNNLFRLNESVNYDDLILIEMNGGKNNSVYSNDFYIKSIANESNKNNENGENSLNSENEKGNLNGFNLKIIVLNSSNNCSFSKNNIYCEIFGNIKGLEISNSDDIQISYNNIFSKADFLRMIESMNSDRVLLKSNDISIEAYSSVAYFGNKSQNDSIIDNNIIITHITHESDSTNTNSENTDSLNHDSIDTNSMNTEEITQEYSVIGLVSGNQTGIYYINSNENIISNNHIESLNSIEDYAVYIASGGEKIQIKNNYLISSSGEKTANEAVYYIDSIVIDNTPYAIYIAPYGENRPDYGNETHPYRTVDYAINNSFNGVIIYLFDGNYSINRITIDKNITIAALNNGDSDSNQNELNENEKSDKRVIFNLENGQLFHINKGNTLTIRDIMFVNGNSINGTVFFNEGELNIINSSFIDNKALNIDNKTVSGFGAVATNYGNMRICDSQFDSNTAHKGGVVMNHGNLTIRNSEFRNNSAVTGAVIYNNGSCEIYNSTFTNNTGINDYRFCKVNVSYNQINSECCNIGSGGVIYSDKNSSLIVDSSRFNENSAVNGGSIYFNSNYVKEEDDSYLEITNCRFDKNSASKEGGAVSAIAKEINIFNSSFTNNEAYSNGGAVYGKTYKGVIDSSYFNNNTSETGGALDCNGNFLIINTFISNNTASNGGAINYKGDSAYGHLVNRVLIYNSTIENNRGLLTGGGFQMSNGNITISDSNIVNNYAPKNPTINSRGSNDYFSADNNNWWGSTSGPSDDVWNSDVNHLKNRNWTRSEIQWNQNSKSQNQSGRPNNNTNNHNGQSTVSPILPGGTDTNLVPIINPNPGEGSGNNPNHGGNSNGTGNGEGNGNGNDSGQGNSNGNGNNGKSEEGDGTGTGYQTGEFNGNSNINNGNTSYNGQNSANSSSNPNLNTVGVTGANPGTSSNAGESSSSASPKAYKINEDSPASVKSSNMNNLILIVLLFAILLFIGYLRKRQKDDEKP